MGINTGNKLNIKKFKKGSGEFISFAVTSLFICAIFLYLVAFVQYFIGLNAITKAANVAARAAAVCTSLEDAEELSAMAADSSISISSIGDISTEIEYCDGDSWSSGNMITVTTTADVTTLSPLTSRIISKSIVVCIESSGSTSNLDYDWDGDVLTPSAGVVMGPSGRETYYNLDMSGVIRIMRNLGYSEDEYPYEVREDGVKTLGGYVMVAANLSIRPRGTILQTSLGWGIVCDTGSFVNTYPYGLDIAVTW